MKPEINFFARGKSRVGHIINQLAHWSLSALVKPQTAKDRNSKPARDNETTA
jgi:hypothetical protein